MSTEPTFTWMMDFDKEDNPWRAHRIVETRRDESGEIVVQVTACGYEATAANHPRGWWDGPISWFAPSAIHCGSDAGTVVPVT